MRPRLGGEWPGREGARPTGRIVLLAVSFLVLLPTPSASAVPNCGGVPAVGEKTYDFACASAAWTAETALCFPSTAPLDWLGCGNIESVGAGDPQSTRTLAYVSCYLNEGINFWLGKCI